MIPGVSSPESASTISLDFTFTFGSLAFFALLGPGIGDSVEALFGFFSILPGVDFGVLAGPVLSGWKPSSGTDSASCFTTGGSFGMFLMTASESLWPGTPSWVQPPLV